MSKILTSEEVLINTLNDMHEGNLADYLSDNPDELKIYSKPILEWGKTLVQAALKAASEKASFLRNHSVSEEDDETIVYDYEIDKYSILNSYPLENIK